MSAARSIWCFYITLSASVKNMNGKESFQQRKEKAFKDNIMLIKMV